MSALNHIQTNHTRRMFRRWFEVKECTQSHAWSVRFAFSLRIPPFIQLCEGCLCQTPLNFTAAYMVKNNDAMLNRGTAQEIEGAFLFSFSSLFYLIMFAHVWNTLFCDLPTEHNKSLRTALFCFVALINLYCVLFFAWARSSLEVGLVVLWMVWKRMDGLYGLLLFVCCLFLLSLLVLFLLWFVSGSLFWVTFSFFICNWISFCARFFFSAFGFLLVPHSCACVRYTFADGNVEQTTKETTNDSVRWSARIEMGRTKNVVFHRKLSQQKHNNHNHHNYNYNDHNRKQNDNNNNTNKDQHKSSWHDKVSFEYILFGAFCVVVGGDLWRTTQTSRNWSAIFFISFFGFISFIPSLFCFCYCCCCCCCCCELQSVLFFDVICSQFSTFCVFLPCVFLCPFSWLFLSFFVSFCSCLFLLVSFFVFAFLCFLCGFILHCWLFFFRKL